MVQRSPCMGCEHEKDDKNGADCRECDRRVAYVEELRSSTTIGTVSTFRGLTDPPAALTRRAADERKTCIRCHAVKDLDEFPHNKMVTGGRENTCKTCKNRMRSENKKRKREALRAAVRADDPEPDYDGVSTQVHRCKICGMTKASTDLYRNKTLQAGLENICKACKSNRYKNRYARRAGATEECHFPADRGPKETEGKLNWSVFPFSEAEPVVRVFEYGKEKYGEAFTYRKGIPVSELWSATMRHMIAIQNGNITDAESGLPHMAHIAANALMMLAQDKQEKTEA